ncbi:MAG TPA: hypothetical protein VK851_05305 [Anaerolineales bacterium]|nr:hypothetical protein [Anaerolineales bacterium]
MFKSRFFNILVAVALLVVLMLTVQEAVATKSVVSEVESVSQLYAANPELMVADRYSPERIGFSETLLFATNPELSVANRYAASTNQISESTFLSMNPELSVVWRYAATRAEK